MRPTAAYHKLQLALQRVKSLFDTMKMPAEQFRRHFFIEIKNQLFSSRSTLPSIRLRISTSVDFMPTRPM